jgi:hypothetical protein
MLARRRLLPGETILTEPSLYFFDRQKHERNGYENCSECNAFYVAEFFDDLEGNSIDKKNFFFLYFHFVSINIFGIELVNFFPFPYK